jgi:hypothetical protein
MSLFHHKIPALSSKSCLPLRVASWPPSLVAFLIRLPRYELFRFRRFRVESPLASGSLSILPTSSVDPWILYKRVYEVHQFVASLPHVLVNVMFHIFIRVGRTPTQRSYVGRRHRRSFVDVQSCLLSPDDSSLVQYHRTNTLTASRVASRTAHSLRKHYRTQPGHVANCGFDPGPSIQYLSRYTVWATQTTM